MAELVQGDGAAGGCGVAQVGEPGESRGLGVCRVFDTHSVGLGGEEAIHISRGDADVEQA